VTAAGNTKTPNTILQILKNEIPKKEQKKERKRKKKKKKLAKKIVIANLIDISVLCL
jgi:hypothetical protein